MDATSEGINNLHPLLWITKIRRHTTHRVVKLTGFLVINILTPHTKLVMAWKLSSAGKSSSRNYPRRGLDQMLPSIMHNYIYRRWFRPYRTSIDQEQFIAKIIQPVDQPLTSGLESAVNWAMRMHTMINDRLESIEADPFYTTLPLFRAVMIVVPWRSYPTCGVLRNIAKISVLVIATGEQRGLSAPITFDSILNEAEAKAVSIGGLDGIETSLDMAVDFVMSLEKREEAVFGPQPDPVAALESPVYSLHHQSYEWCQSYAERLGWTGDPIVGPSSEWVDTKRYKRWTGGGAYVDAGMMAQRERVVWRLHDEVCICYDDSE